MKKIIYMLLQFIIIQVVSADDFPYIGLEYGASYTSIDFISSDNCEITFNNPERDIFEYDFYYSHKVPFIVINENEKSVFLFNKYFAIASPLVISLETSFERPYVEFFSSIFHVTRKYLKTSFGNWNTKVNSSSYLTEGEIEYTAENLLNPLGIPWVEGVKGNGIGEYIELQWFNDEVYHKGVKFLAICSGYISYEKPYLYEYNSRPKKIEILDLDNNISTIHDLLDTPNPQFVFLQQSTQNIRITIVEAYSGSKWNDTCIDYIIGFTEEMWNVSDYIPNGENTGP